ncbi:MAG: phage tail protein [Acidimicrobiia bacterium]|nr:phage tail protein [Acidimicrobiia bacterium]MDX2467462.1 phage tail protein [Acidimicrobiia bacterium]
MPRQDPYGAFGFLVSIDGLDVAGFTEVSGLEYEIEVIEYREGNETTDTVRKIPGLVKYTNIVLKRGITADNSFWEWVVQPLGGPVERRSGVISILDENHEPVASWEFTDAWPCKYVGPKLQALNSTVAIETLEICHEGLRLVGR